MKLNEICYKCKEEILDFAQANKSFGKWFHFECPKDTRERVFQEALDEVTREGR